MPDQNPIVEAEPSGTEGVSAFSPSASRSSGILAGRFRWVICGLLFLGVTKNYMDRQVLGVLKIPLQHEFGWNDIHYGHLVFAFQAAYALGMILVGRLIDRLGTRIGYAAAMIFWSLASMGHAIAHSLTGFVVARSALGFGEAGLFPASLKCVAEWFPKKERALATGIFNAGTSVGAIVTPLIVPWIAVHLGWRWAFLLTGSLGFAWLILWLWFYLFWIPDYLQREHGLHLTQIGLPILVIYVIADLGSIGGGWLSSMLIRRHFSVNAARKWAMLSCALSVLPVAIVFRVSGLWPATLLIGLAAAGHQGFSANLFTLPSDLFPSRAVASVVGIGGMAGAVGGMLIAEIVGHILQWTGSYMIPFFIAASAYLIALLFIHLLSPKLVPTQIGQG